MKALVTRPRADALALAEALAARGIEAVIEQLVTIRPKTEAGALLDAALGGAQALLFTSANAARVFAGASPRRDLAVFAVGDATARAAKAAGFTRVESAQGAAAELAKLAAATLTVSVPFSFASCATTGASPLPVARPSPATMNTIFAPSKSDAISPLCASERPLTIGGVSFWSIGHSISSFSPPVHQSRLLAQRGDDPCSRAAYSESQNLARCGV